VVFVLAVGRLSPLLDTIRAFHRLSPSGGEMFLKIGERKLGEALVCKLYKKVAFSHTGPKEAIFTRLRCKQWHCEFCAKKNASIWRAFLAEKLPTIGSEWFLVTLTAHSQTRSKNASMDNLRQNLDRFWKRVKRVFGDIEYVRTFEKHPTSEAVHVHYIVSGLCPFVAVGCSAKLRPMAIGTTTRKGRNGVWSIKTWFKITAQECAMGYIADVRLLAGEITRAIWYVTKYLTKEQSDLHVKGLRHVQTTRGIGSPKSMGELEWETANYIVAKMFAAGTHITDLNTGEIIDNNHWEKHSFYPHED